MISVSGLCFKPNSIQTDIVIYVLSFFLLSGRMIARKEYFLGALISSRQTTYVRTSFTFGLIQKYSTLCLLPLVKLLAGHSGATKPHMEPLQDISVPQPQVPPKMRKPRFKAGLQFSANQHPPLDCALTSFPERRAHKIFLSISNEVSIPPASPNSGRSAIPPK